MFLNYGDITVMVDWAFKINYLSIYLSAWLWLDEDVVLYSAYGYNFEMDHGLGMASSVFLEPGLLCILQ